MFPNIDHRIHIKIYAHHFRKIDIKLFKILLLNAFSQILSFFLGVLFFLWGLFHWKICTAMWGSESIVHRRGQTKARAFHDDVIKWNHFPRNWPLCAGNSPVPVNSLHKGQWRGALMFSLICVWINGWVNTREAGDLRRHRGHYEVNVMSSDKFEMIKFWCVNDHLMIRNVRVTWFMLHTSYQKRTTLEYRQYPRYRSA